MKTLLLLITPKDISIKERISFFLSTCPFYEPILGAARWKEDLQSTIPFIELNVDFIAPIAPEVLALSQSISCNSLRLRFIFARTE